MVLRPEKEAEARAVFEKWDLDFAIVGETIAEDRFSLSTATVKADLPLSKLSSEAPEYDRPWVANPPAPEMDPVPEVDPIDALKALIASPNYCSRAWVYEQYDTGHGRHDPHPRLGARASCASTAPTRRWPSPPTSRRATCAPTPSKAASRRWPRPSATSAPWARGRWPPPTTSISATPKSPRSWASSSARSKASARPAPRSTCRSCRATSRSTTRPTDRRSCPRPPSARWVFWSVRSR
jgi:hypothetical protein